MQNFLKLISPKRPSVIDSQKLEGNSPQKTEASPTKESSPGKKTSGDYDSLIIRRPTQFTFNLNSFDKNKHSRTQSQSMEEPSLRQSLDKEKQLQRNVIYDNQAYREKEAEEQLMTTAQSNNDLFSMIFLNQNTPHPKVAPDQEIEPPFSKEPVINQIDYDLKEIEQIAFGQIPVLKVSDFEIGKKLGAGKFGQVFLARHKETGFFCALKKIEKAQIDSRLTVQLVREIKIQSFLNHPNIVKMYSFFTDETSIYLAMELCYSGQLYSYLKKWRRLPEESTRAIVLQICRALDYMHVNEIIHRDLKPQNILYQSGLVKICDFGWSIGTNIMRGTFCGTPVYVSPELLKRKNYNNKIDVWSVGILTYQLLFGKVPFQIQTERDFVKIVEDQIKFSKVTKISEEAKDFILSCLQKDPIDRRTVAQLLEHPFLTKQEAPPMLDMY